MYMYMYMYMQLLHVEPTGAAFWPTSGEKLKICQKRLQAYETPDANENSLGDYMFMDLLRCIKLTKQALKLQFSANSAWSTVISSLFR